MPLQSPTFAPIALLICCVAAYQLGKAKGRWQGRHEEACWWTELARTGGDQRLDLLRLHLWSAFFAFRDRPEGWGDDAAFSGPLKGHVAFTRDRSALKMLVMPPDWSSAVPAEVLADFQRLMKNRP